MKMMWNSKKDVHPYTIRAFKVKSYDLGYSMAIGLINNYLITSNSVFRNKVSGTYDLFIEIINIKNNSVLCKAQIPPINLRNVIISENGRYVAVFSSKQTGQAFLFEIRNKTLVFKSDFIATIDPKNGTTDKPGLPIAISNDGKWLLCQGEKLYEYAMWSMSPWRIRSKFTIEEKKLDKFGFRVDEYNSDSSGKFSDDSKNINIGTSIYKEDGSVNAINFTVYINSDGKIIKKSDIKSKLVEVKKDEYLNCLYTSHDGNFYSSKYVYVNKKNFLYKNNIKLFSYGDMNFNKITVSNDKYILNHRNLLEIIAANVMKIPD